MTMTNAARLAFSVALTLNGLISCVTTTNYTWRSSTFELRHFNNVSSATIYSTTSSKNTKLQCGIVCVNDEACAGYARNGTSGCDLYGNELRIQNHTEEETDNSTFPAYLKIETVTNEPACLNGGILSASNNTCFCVDGWLGDSCNTLMEDCEEGKDFGYTVDTWYWAQPPLVPEPIKIPCLMSGDKAIMEVQERVSENITFNLTWQEFKDGFDFDPLPDFWLGNDKIHFITASFPYILTVTVYSQGNTHERYFVDFVMANESNHFAVTYSSSFTNMAPENSLESCWDGSSIKFSTYDNDNDGEQSINCAGLFGSGWWYQSPECSICNPNGALFPDETQRRGILSENFWNEPVGNNSISRVKMSLSRS